MIILLRGRGSVHKVDLVSLPELCQDSVTALDDGIPKSAGYDWLRDDHATNSNRGCKIVCVFWKTYLDLKLIDDKYLQERLISEIFSDRKILAN